MNHDSQSLYQLDHHIKALRAAAERLIELAEDYPAVVRNTHRILASVKMLELNVSDVVDLDETGQPIAGDG